MGRRIYENLKKAMVFILAVHIPIVGMSLNPRVLKWPLALLPVHILFLELIIDPACTIIFEMERGAEGLMSSTGRTTWMNPYLAGIVILAVSFRGWACWRLYLPCMPSALAAAWEKMRPAWWF